jgi:hypothetical protein
MLPIDLLGSRLDGFQLLDCATINRDKELLAEDG